MSVDILSPVLLVTSSSDCLKIFKLPAYYDDLINILLLIMTILLIYCLLL
jgi:hypothetical protein